MRCHDAICGRFVRNKVFFHMPIRRAAIITTLLSLFIVSPTLAKRIGE